MLKIIIRLFFGIVLLINSSSFSFAKKPMKFIEDVTQKASKILVKNLNKEEKTSQLISLAEKSVDIRGVGLYTLGKHRKVISKEQMNEYEKLFRKYFLKSFASRLSEYSDPKINVLSQNVINKNYTIV